MFNMILLKYKSITFKLLSKTKNEYTVHSYMYSINYNIYLYKLCKVFLYFVGLQAVIEIIDLKMNSVMKTL